MCRRARTVASGGASTDNELMRDANWIGRELRGKDKGKLTELLQAAHRWEALYVKAAFARDNRWDARVDGEAAAAATDGWWYGVFRDGTSLEAVMFAENRQAQVYAVGEEAAKGFAAQLYASQKRIGTTLQTHRHYMTGESKMMNFIWPVLKDLPGRRLVLDKDCELLRAEGGDGAAPSSRASLVVAQRPDERAVSDFLAELQIEQLAMDPRKLGPSAHAHRVATAIGEGRALLAKEKDTGRPFFCAELVPLDEQTVMLSDVYIPAHYRARAKLVAHAFWAAAREPHPLVSGKDLVYLAADSNFATVARTHGWKTVARYRWTVTHG